MMDVNEYGPEPGAEIAGDARDALAQTQLARHDNSPVPCPRGLFALSLPFCRERNQGGYPWTTTSESGKWTWRLD